MPDRSRDAEEFLREALQPSLTPDQLDYLDRRISGLRPPKARKYPRSMRVSLLLAAALALIVPAAFAVSNSWRSLDGPDQDDSAYVMDASALRSLTPLPPAVTWPPLAAPYATASCLPGEDDLMCADGKPVQIMYAPGIALERTQGFALCAWIADWATATSTGDAARTARDVRALDGARRWQSFTDARLAGGVGIWPALFDAIDRGDTASVLAQAQPLCSQIAGPSSSTR
jgi:hypothetical protein